MGIIIRSKGMLTTVQDLGRMGHQKSGIAVSGALDSRSYSLANLLVGNGSAAALEANAGAAALEMTLMGATVEFTEANVVAIVGADMGATLNGQPTPLYAAFSVQKGDVLAFGLAVAGCRTYLAFAGGLDLPEVLGSRSTNLKCSLGGYQGRALSEGDSIPFAAPVASLPEMGKRVLPPEDFSSTSVLLRAVPGPQEAYFSGEGIQTFFGASFSVSARSDRMGCVLDGQVIPSASKTDIVSDGIPLGAVQISSDGKPIVMLADRQTTGGYAKIAVVASVDIPLLAQRKPGDTVRFSSISVAAAQKLFRQERKEAEKMRRRFSV